MEDKEYGIKSRHAYTAHMANAPEVDLFFGRAKKLGASNKVLRRLNQNCFLHKIYNLATHVDIVMDIFQTHCVLRIGRQHQFNFVGRGAWTDLRIGIAGG